MYYRILNRAFTWTVTLWSCKWYDGEEGFRSIYCSCERNTWRCEEYRPGVHIHFCEPHMHMHRPTLRSFVLQPSWDSMHWTIPWRPSRIFLQSFLNTSSTLYPKMIWKVRYPCLMWVQVRTTPLGRLTSSSAVLPTISTVRPLWSNTLPAQRRK